MNKTSIEWTDYTWNPVTGCTKVSQGCKNCYAETMTRRFEKTWGHSFREVVMHTDRLNEPLEMKKKLKGKRVFVCDMSDLFHEAVSFEFIYSVFSRIACLPETTFQILTKRIDRAVEFYRWLKEVINNMGYSAELLIFPQLPLPNVWIGTSVEDQKNANERIPFLMQIPAAVRFLSCEPLLGPIDFEEVPTTRLEKVLNGKSLGLKKIHYIDWVIAGGESGHKARPMHPDWVKSLRDQCQVAGVPFFFKQWGHYIPSYQAGELCDEVANYQKTYGERWATSVHHFPDGLQMVRVGKSKSGNFLDGKQHLEFPKPYFMIKVLVPGHRYEVEGFQNQENKQTIDFIHKEPIEGTNDLRTVCDGTTNEDILMVLIDRMQFLQSKFPCRENAIVITKLEESLMWLEKRTADRKKRNVEGKHLS